jgi:hypothetical protein
VGEDRTEDLGSGDDQKRDLDQRRDARGIRASGDRRDERQDERTDGPRR